MTTKTQAEHLARTVERNHKSLRTGNTMLLPDLNHIEPGNQLHANVLVIQKHAHDVKTTSLGMQTRLNKVHSAFKPTFVRTYMWQLVAYQDGKMELEDLKSFMSDESRLDLEEPPILNSLRAEFFGEVESETALNGVVASIKDGAMEREGYEKIAEALSYAGRKSSKARDVLDGYEEHLFPNRSSRKRSVDCEEVHESGEPATKRFKVEKGLDSDEE